MRNRLTPWLFLATLAFAFVLANCGGDDEDGGAGGAAQQVITVNWGTEPPSLDPGLASDTIAAAADGAPRSDGRS